MFVEEKVIIRMAFFFGVDRGFKTGGICRCPNEVTIADVR